MAGSYRSTIPSLSARILYQSSIADFVSGITELNASSASAISLPSFDMTRLLGALSMASLYKGMMSSRLYVRSPHNNSTDTFKALDMRRADSKLGRRLYALQPIIVWYFNPVVSARKRRSLFCKRRCVSTFSQKISCNSFFSIFVIVIAILTNVNKVLPSRYLDNLIDNIII